ncbi:ATP-binding cassette domain-containing protein [Nakamurella sp. YIM 132087]|uniref:ATP-binding cassette domain-containing protein n=1 Tax=Nakamurella alba TaxID=2665158 RepID=A0A7K1FEK7_9ACTN|nr:ATP-binding cassette domain-containing protein [Nakamurella alba]MTD12531.1 ATP-binding cassette domain-containing protein [Nakamurella alba]
MPPTLSVHGLRKSFGIKRVLDDVSFRIRPGTLHALLGANGAGKSTLIKILTGIERSDAGEISVRGAEGGPGRIGVIHQDLGLVSSMSVADNLYLVPGAGPLHRVSPSGDVRRARVQLAGVNVEVDPRRELGSLSLGERTMVAISRLFERDEPDLIILDEVTAALNRVESDWLLGRVREFVDRGGAAMVVTHRLHEVTTHCDEVTVLRDGKVVRTGPVPALPDLHDDLAAGDITTQEPVDAGAAASGAVVLAATAATTAAVGPISLDVRAGEVVAVVGALSSRLYEIGHLLAGIVGPVSGRVVVSAPAGGPGRAALLPEERLTQGVLTGLTVADNAVLDTRPRGRTGLWRGVNRRRGLRTASEVVERMNVRPEGCEGMPMLALSGGNQQKVLLGRIALQEPDLYVLCEPTRGVDLPTRAAIRRFVLERKAEGAAVVVATIDVDDALAVADRLAIAENGRLVSVVDRAGVQLDDLLERVS